MQSKNKQTIYIYNLPKSATQEDLETIFLNFGEIVSCELDKNSDSAYIEFQKELSADRALDMDNVEMGSHQVRVVTAFKENFTENPVTYTLSSKKIDYSTGNQIFVGDIGYNVDERMLTEKFSEFGNIFETKVVRMPDGKHRGFAFISYNNEADAEKAIQAMNNAMFYNRKIKCNWASKKKHSPDNNQTRKPLPNRVQPIKTFEEICTETTDTNTSVYVTGENLFEHIIRPCFERFGYIRSIKAFPEKNHAFVNYEAHDAAAHAILQLNGYTIGDTTLKCAWGKKGAANETDKRMNSSPNGQQFVDLSQIQLQQQQPLPQFIDIPHSQPQPFIDSYQSQPFDMFQPNQQQQFANYQNQQYLDMYHRQQYFANAQNAYFQSTNPLPPPMVQQYQHDNNVPPQPSQTSNSADTIDYYANLQYYLQQQQHQNYLNQQQNGGSFQSQRFFK